MKKLEITEQKMFGLQKVIDNNIYIKVFAFNQINMKCQLENIRNYLISNLQFSNKLVVKMT